MATQFARLREAFQEKSPYGQGGNVVLLDRYERTLGLDEAPDICRNGWASWTLAPGLTDHAGSLLAPDRDFFEPPPEEIGPVLSAETSLSTGSQPMNPALRTILILIGTALGIMAATLLVIWAGVTAKGWIITWYSLGSLVGFGITLGLTAFEHTCTYVGKFGVARFRCRSNRANLYQSQVLAFNRTLKLHTSLVSRYTNNSYQGTDYVFNWTDAHGSSRFYYSGTFNAEEGLPPAGDAYHFATAAELAWSVYLSLKAEDDLQNQGSFLFQLANGDWLRIGDSWIDIHQGGQTNHCERRDLAQAGIGNGQVHLQRRDAQVGWFTSTGVYNLNVKDIPNVRLFLAMFQMFVAPEALPL